MHAQCPGFIFSQMASKGLAVLAAFLIWNLSAVPVSFNHFSLTPPQPPRAAHRSAWSRERNSASTVKPLESLGFGTVRFANNAVLLGVAIALLVVQKPAVSAWIGFAIHAVTTGMMRRFPCPIKIPKSFRRDARSNLAKSYIAQVILLALALTSASPTSAMISRYLLFALIFVTSIFFDWPDPPLLDQAPALVFPGASLNNPRFDFV